MRPRRDLPCSKVLGEESCDRPTPRWRTLLMCEGAGRARPVINSSQTPWHTHKSTVKEKSRKPSDQELKNRREERKRLVLGLPKGPDSRSIVASRTPSILRVKPLSPLWYLGGLYWCFSWRETFRTMHNELKMCLERRRVAAVFCSVVE